MSLPMRAAGPPRRDARPHDAGLLAGDRRRACRRETAWWSSEIGVIAVTAGRSTTLVASSRPPRPVSSRTTSAGMREKARKAAAVVISKKVIGSPPLACSHPPGRRPERRRRSARRPAGCARGSAPDAARCRRGRDGPPPPAWRAGRRSVEPLPLVPATWIDRRQPALRDCRALPAAARCGPSDRSMTFGWSVMQPLETRSAGQRSVDRAGSGLSVALCGSAATGIGSACGLGSTGTVAGPAASPARLRRRPAAQQDRAAAQSASRAARRAARPGRPCRAPSGIRRAGSRPAGSRGWSARSRAAPAKPISAPGSARCTSPSMAKEAVTPPGGRVGQHDDIGQARFLDARRRRRWCAASASATGCLPACGRRRRR